MLKRKKFQETLLSNGQNHLIKILPKIIVAGKKAKEGIWNKDTEKRIETIYSSLKKDPKQFYLSASVIQTEWYKRYPDISPPPLRTIGQIMADKGLSDKRSKGRSKGAARYLCYPENTLNLFFERILETDFIGKKFITGRTEPLNFIGFSFKKAEMRQNRSLCFLLLPPRHSQS